jgi:uncharacterized membrane protein
LNRARDTLEDRRMLDAKQRSLLDAKQRYLFIDLLRFIAAFFMIQGHVFDALLLAQVKAHPLYYRHDFFHGFIAPAFLFASGVAFGVSTMKRWEEHILLGKRFWYRAMRFVGLIAIGYALHLPYFSLRKTLNEASAAELKAFFQSDVLQCIGLTLLLLQIGLVVVKSRKAFPWIVAGAAAGVIFASPLMWSAQLSGVLPMPIVSYLTPENASWFPLFPWAGYILCGAFFGFVLAEAKDATRSTSLMRRSVVLSVGIVLLAWALMYVPFDIYPAHDFWKSNPLMFFVRVGVVTLAASGIHLLQQKAGLAPRLALLMGRDSLFIYVLHLVIVYGSVLNRGLSQRIGPTLPLGQTLGMVAAVFGGIALITVLWYMFKTKYRTAASWVTIAGAAIFVIEFIVRPW